MMIARTFLTTLALGAVACGSQPPPAAPTPLSSAPAQGTERPQGAADPNASVSNAPSAGEPSTGPAKSTSVSNAPSAPRGRMPCSQEIALQCASGLVDGCISNMTNWHVCVEKGQNTMPCSQEVAMKCGAGRTDACLLDPKGAKVHVCAQN